MNLLVTIAAADPGTEALIEGDRLVTYGELTDLALRTAAGLRARGITGRRRVAAIASTCVDGVVAYLGIQAAGGAAVMLNPRSPRAELEAQLARVDVSLAIVAATDVDLPAAFPAARPAGTAPTDDFPILDEPRNGILNVAPEDPAAILFTSGIAGAPRPVVLSHANLAAVRRGLVDQPGSNLTASTIALCLLPLAHVFGLNSALGAVLEAGGAAVLLERFDPVESLDLVARHRVTAISAVPQIWAAWAATAEARPEIMATVTRATSSAEHLPTKTVEAVRERLGRSIAGGYGLTETSGTIALDDVAAPTPPCVGRPLGAAQLRLLDDSGLDAEVGDRGEIWVRGPSVCAGYVDDEPSAHSTLHPGGWCRTGDVGIFDDVGRLMVVDRVKDVVIVGGFNVSPTEVENVLMTHPGVSGAVVVGEVDEDAGERVVAFVSPAARTVTLEPAELADHCRRRLARYKVPSRIEIRPELPKTSGGKPIRRLLR